MPFYKKLGKIPKKRHTVFKSKGGKLYYEELFGNEGFHGSSSLLYHINRPTRISNIDKTEKINDYFLDIKNLHPRLFDSSKLDSKSDYIKSRRSILSNGDCKISLFSSSKSLEDYFYKNADANEVIFVHKGKGKFRSMMGNLDFKSGDYIVVPKGVIYQVNFSSNQNRWFIVESGDKITFPKRYLNEYGQILESAPFCERDIKTPSDIETYDKTGKFLIKIKKHNIVHNFIYETHPFDLVGWDGYNFPYIFSIHDFEPITGRIHMPPPIHQTFASKSFVICSFCPRIYDYHPNSIPAPYHHSNIDSDEVIFYVDGNFMSRNKSMIGYISLHPQGIPHGPHPGATENSIGKKQTNELAVMVDTFNPLKISTNVINLEDKNYYKSWKENLI